MIHFALSVNLFPGDPLTLFFDEELECEGDPNYARVTMTVSEMNVTFDSFSNVVSPDLLLVCAGNQLEIQFVEKSLPQMSFNQLLGHTYQLMVENAQDNAGNVLEDYTLS